MTDSESVSAMVDATLAEFGAIDILVNNAGGATEGFGNSARELTDEQWRVGIDTNLTGAMYCSRAVIPHMLERGGGKIINVTSGFGLRAGRNNFMYTSAKAGLINFTRSLAMTYAPDIQANLIAPGLFPHGDSADVRVVEARQVHADGPPRQGRRAWPALRLPRLRPDVAT